MVLILTNFRLSMRANTREFHRLTSNIWRPVRKNLEELNRDEIDGQQEIDISQEMAETGDTLEIIVDDNSFDT